MKTRAQLRWLILLLLFAATAISYIDRHSLTVVAPRLRDELGISNFGYARIVASFLLSYTIMQAVTGWLIDRLGTRKGFALIMLWWSLAAMLHALGQGVVSFSIFRFLLGAGQAGSWAACVRAVSEWFPPNQRGTANGIWGSGTSAGMVVSVPLVAWITLGWGWQMAFLVTGLLGFVWLALWLWLFHVPEQPPSSGSDEPPAEVGRARPIRYVELLRNRSVWAVVLARMFADPTTWFYHYWTPEYLSRTAGFTLAEIGRYGWIPFFVQGVAIVLGGLSSDWLQRKGWRAISSRLVVMFVGTILMTAGVLASLPVSVTVAFAGISIACFGFGLWAPNMMSLCGDAFPRSIVGSVTGLSGLGAGVGGTGFTLLTGWILDRMGYQPVFLLAAIMPIAAFAILFSLLDRRAAPSDEKS